MRESFTAGCVPPQASGTDYLWRKSVSNFPPALVLQALQKFYPPPFAKRQEDRLSGDPLVCKSCKPSSVLQRAGASIIYLRRRSPAASSNLPPGIGRATLNCRYTWSCNPRDVLTGRHHCLRGGLLPRLFTLALAGGHSLLRCYTLTNIKPLTCVALSVARTFLPRPKPAAMERICRTKIRLKNESAHISAPNLSSVSNRLPFRSVAVRASDGTLRRPVRHSGMNPSAANSSTERRKCSSVSSIDTNDLPPAALR